MAAAFEQGAKDPLHGVAFSVSVWTVGFRAGPVLFRARTLRMTSFRKLDTTDIV